MQPRQWTNQPQPMFAAQNIQYEIAERTQGLASGGIGAMHLLARRIGLIEMIDRHLHLLKQHKPYHESDHVLNIAYNLLCGGTRLEHLELRRNDEVYAKALGAQRIPDPTTAGDFCRRFSDLDVLKLMQIFNRVRQRVWRQQPPEFFEHAVIDGDGTLAPTYGECKQGMDIGYDGQWGYHPLLLSLANTGEPLYWYNRSGNRPSHEGAAVFFDLAIALCRESGFRKITLRGDTDFSQTKYSGRLARRPRAIHLRLRRPRQREGGSGKTAGNGLETPGPPREAHGENQPATKAGKRQGADRGGSGSSRTNAC